MIEWELVYERAIKEDGSLFFPERHSMEFLNDRKRVLGSYAFANNYQNEIIPLDDQTFKKTWIKYYSALPDETLHYFVAIDPAISEADTADFTAWVVVAVDAVKNWYIVQADRAKINPTQIIEKAFSLAQQYQARAVGIEDVAYQRALIHFASERMQREKIQLPIMGIKRGPDKSKQTRILSMVPRFENNAIFLRYGLYALEKELLQFPRGAHDDLIDALCSINDIVYYPEPRRVKDDRFHPSAQAAEYEQAYRRKLSQQSSARVDDWEGNANE